MVAAKLVIFTTLSVSWSLAVMLLLTWPERTLSCSAVVESFAEIELRPQTNLVSHYSGEKRSRVNTIIGNEMSVGTSTIANAWY